VGSFGLEVPGSVYGPVAVSCEHGTEKFEFHERRVG
jgi:hypothetical protein